MSSTHVDATLYKAAVISAHRCLRARLSCQQRASRAIRIRAAISLRWCIISYGKHDGFDFLQDERAHMAEHVKAEIAKLAAEVAGLRADLQILRAITKGEIVEI